MDTIEDLPKPKPEKKAKAGRKKAGKEDKDEAKTGAQKISNRAAGRETLEICEKGFYEFEGEKVDISEAQKFAMNNSVLYTPDGIYSQLPVREQFPTFETQYEFCCCTTLEAAFRLAPEGDVAVLNFASAKNAGGGFLNGAQAQEESIARSSGLYPCQTQPSCFDYYTKNRLAEKNLLYTHHVIYSPKVPVFRSDDRQLLPKFYTSSIITCPAINGGSRRRVQDQDLVDRIFYERAERVLAVAFHHSHEILILGAWGCGVFRNHVIEVARLFRRLLIEEDKYKNVFKKVVFAINVQSTSDEFQRYFSDGSLPLPPEFYQFRQKQTSKDKPTREKGAAKKGGKNPKKDQSDEKDRKDESNNAETDQVTTQASDP